MKKTRLIPILLVALFAAGAGGWKVFDLYCAMRARHSLKMAQAFIQQGRINEAVLCVRSSLQIRKKNPEACQFLAGLMENAGSPEALVLRKKAAAMLPDDARAQLDLAKCALRFNQTERAGEALAAVPQNCRDQPEYIETEARFHSLSNHPFLAAELYGEIVERWPDTPEAKAAILNLAQLWLTFKIPGKPEKAADQLERLSTDPQVGLTALRLRVQIALEKNDYPAALRLGCQLAKSPGAEFVDQIRLLDILQLNRCPLLDAALRWLELSVAGYPERTALTAEWILKQKGAQPVVEWLESLPGEEVKKMPIPIVLADCYTARKAWSSLEKLLTNQDWGTVDGQRKAFLAMAYRNLESPDAAKFTWQTAVNAALNHPGSLASLARLAISEKRFEDAREALWKIPSADPEYAWARQLLFAYYRQHNDTGQLLRLLEEALVEHPGDPATKRSVAALLLIADRQLSRAAKLAREAYASDPQSIGNTAVYAFSIHLQGDSAKAAALLDRRSAAEKSSDECLPYYGLILAACKRTEEARECFRKMNPDILLPEMQKKITAAEAGLGK